MRWGLFLLAPLLLLWMAGDGLRSGFFPDDMMNLYGAWREPWLRLVAFNLPGFPGGYRPVGALLYRALFELFALNPLPYRILCWLLLLANLYLAWRLMQAASGCWAVASLGATLGAYHAYFSDLYYSTATIYDLLCYGLYCGTLLYYFRRRSRGRLGWRALLVIAGLQWLALNAKETAVTLPAMLLVSEWLFGWAPKRDFRATAICGLLVLVGLAGKLTGPRALNSNPAYAPDPGLLGANLGHYYGLLFYRPEAMPAAGVFLLLVSVWLAAWLLRRRPVVPFAAALLTLTPVPVLAIPPRSLYVFALPATGWGLFAAALAFHLFPLRRWPLALRQVLLTSLGLAVLVPLHVARRPFANHWLASEEPKMRTLLAELDRRLPALAPGSRILVLEDPFDRDDWILTSLFRLRYRDDSIEVRRIKQAGAPPPEQWRAYHYVLAIRDWRIEILEHAPWEDGSVQPRRASPIPGS
ncbi:MAG: hypothetical protein NZ554_05675 [Bryobacteraceae bacterium]|nr:hypothetical protein [Bryobacteraceae bacterium]